MRIFNYSNYAKVIRLGISDNNKTEIVQILFEPLIDCEIKDVLNKNGEMYNFKALA